MLAFSFGWAYLQVPPSPALSGPLNGLWVYLTISTLYARQPVAVHEV